ncbi:hypothetical protein Q1695_006229 [Nippostrongylus brasiliensis]|nr:hypothetical protein Q1695_006229 [Nippostrongylus brasiliensis]
MARTTSDFNWDAVATHNDPTVRDPNGPFQPYCTSHSTSSMPSSPLPIGKSRSVVRYDPSPLEERMKSMQSLLTSIYHEDSITNSMRELPDSLTESFQSDFSMVSNRRCPSIDTLQQYDRAKIIHEIAMLRAQIEKANQRLVKMVRQRSYYRAKHSTKCAVLSAILMANSPKTRADSKLRFSLEPPPAHGAEGVEEWKRAMRAMARIPGGLPPLVRCKLWSVLGSLYIKSAGLDWEQIRRNGFSEKVQPDDSKIHSQILKDLHRTGWSEFDDEKKLKQVLLAYARFNKDVGYCQGFNVIAALILQVVEYRTDVALKVMMFLIEHVMPHGYFDQSLGALSVDMTVMKDLMMQRLPTTMKHLESLQNSSENEYEPPLPNIFSMHWFLTLFATCLPRDCVMRVWDALMLHGSEILLRTAIALWGKMSRKILRTSTADEFYTLMGKLTKELMEMSGEDQDHLMTVVYTMAELPYPGLAELREKHKWNIQPLSPTFKMLRRNVSNILHDEDHADTKCSPCDIRGKISRIDDNLSTWCNLRSLEKQYQLTKTRQKQAAVIMNNAYLHGLSTSVKPSKSVYTSPLPTSPLVFNHLLVGPLLTRKNTLTKPPTTLSGGAVQLAATIIQPTDNDNVNHHNSRLFVTDANQSEAPQNDVWEEQMEEHLDRLRRSKTMLRTVKPSPLFKPSLRRSIKQPF